MLLDDRSDIYWNIRSEVGVRTGAAIGTGVDDYQPSELWQVDSDDRHPILLVRCHESFDGDMSSVVAQFNELRFSPDGRLGSL